MIGISVTGTGGKPTQGLATRLRSLVKEAGDGDAQAVVPVVEELLKASFDARQTPSGEAWRPRVSGGSWPLLEKTSRMKASLRVRAVRGSVEMSYETPANYHQSGTTRMVARKLLPENALPPTWSARIGEARRRWWAERFGK